MPTVSLIANNFVPTTSFTGSEQPTILRGKNAKIRAVSGRARIENYPGHKNLSETYNLANEVLTGNLSWTTDSEAVIGTNTSFTSTLRPGMMVLTSQGEPFVVRIVTDDTHFTSDRPATTTFAAKNFVDANVNTGTDRITVTLHGFTTGDAILLTTTGVLPSGTGIAANTILYVIVVDANTISLATTYANAIALTAIDITSAAGGGTHTVSYGAMYGLVLFEIDKQRGVLRRGNAIKEDKKDIIFVGDGSFFLNGTDTGFDATRRPKRLQRAVSGTYTEYAIGFNAVPPQPVIDPAAGGWKGMQAGNYSFMLSYWNSVDDSFSNPCNVVKKDSGGATDIVLTAGQRFRFDLTTSLVGMPANADGFIIWGSQSGGGVAAVNTSNFNQGAWLRVAKIRTTAYTIVDADVDPATDQITISGHKFKTADSVYFNTTWGGFTAGTEYFAIRIDDNALKFATTAVLANAGTAIDITADPGVGTHTVRSISSTDQTHIEYLDAEMGAVASGDNDAPPDCEWVMLFANYRHYVSALGKKTNTKSLGSSPGNYVLPGKVTNKGAVPYDWRVSLDDEITGAVPAIGRLFCMTANDLRFVTPTGRTELARLSPTVLDMPFSQRAFWTKGGISPYQIVIIQGDIFLYTGRTLLRSPSNADTNVVPFELGLPVTDLTESWYDGFSLLGHDPKNQELCLIASATHKNSQGFWVSQILPYSLQKNQFQPIIEVSSTTADSIVTGVATVNNRMEFLAGGRGASGALELATFQYDQKADGKNISWYVAFQPVDLGEEQRQKKIRSLRVTARSSSAILQVHGARAGGNISITDIENGTNSLSGDITIPDSAQALTREHEIPYLVKRLQIASLRYSDTWSPSDTLPHRLDEVVVDMDIHGTGQ